MTKRPSWACSAGESDFCPQQDTSSCLCERELTLQPRISWPFTALILEFWALRACVEGRVEPGEGSLTVHFARAIRSLLNRMAWICLEV